MWRTIEFDSSINHFAHYDLRHTIPCPDTRAKAALDRNYAKRRAGPKDIGKDLRIMNTPAQRHFPRPGGEGNSVREMARNFERGNNSARRNLRGIMDNGEVPGIHPEDPLYTALLQQQESRGAVSLEETLEETPAQEGEDSPDRLVRERLEDIRTQVKDGSQNLPAAKKPKQGATPNVRLKKNGGRRGQ